MVVLFLHGWTSVPGGRKPIFLQEHGHTVLNPSLPDEDFEEAVKIAQVEYNQHQPDVVVGSSRGGAVAMNIESGNTPLVLLCPAWKNWGNARSAKPNTTILHSRSDDVVPFEHSLELVTNSGLPPEALIEIGNDHRLADPEPLAKMLELCGVDQDKQVVDVTVYYLEMYSPSDQSVPAPRDGLTVIEVPTPDVSYYRNLYNVVGKDYHWLSRRKISDAELAAIICAPLNGLEINV